MTLTVRRSTTGHPGAETRDLGAGQTPGRGRPLLERFGAELAAASDAPVESFSPDAIAGLPDLAQRYFLHAIQPGTPLARPVRLEMSGEMRLGAHAPWLPFEARELLAPPDGFVWEARVGNWGLSFAGADSYLHGEGRTRFRLWSLLPLVDASGPDVSRSARGRLAGEMIWNPASLLPQWGVTWSTIDASTVCATIVVDGEAIPLGLRVREDGRLLSVRLARWGNLTADGRYRPIPFGADVLDEQTFGGYTVPSRLAVRWWCGTDRELHFFSAEIGQAAFGASALRLPA
ncbi:MAG: DUF6544 family protein [Chloroflexota bacterium]